MEIQPSKSYERFNQKSSSVYSVFMFICKPVFVIPYYSLLQLQLQTYICPLRI